MNYNEYIVKKGDSLYLISKKYNTTPTELMKINNLSSSMIYPNQILYVPMNNYEYIEYKTTDGDTIDSILEKFKITPEMFNLSNNVYHLELLPNQKINLVDDEYYEVLAGDTFNSILSKANISCLELLELNPGLLVPGMKIRIK